MPFSGSEIVNYFRFPTILRLFIFLKKEACVQEVGIIMESHVWFSALAAKAAAVYTYWHEEENLFPPLAC